MPGKKKVTGRGPMIHIRLGIDTHKDLKVSAVQNGTTIQNVVEGLIEKYLQKEKRLKYGHDKT